MTSAGVQLGIEAARRLAKIGAHRVEPGPTDQEFARVEDEYGFRFADDHRAFLTAGLAVNAPFTPEPDV